MSIGQRIINFIEKRRSDVQKKQHGPFGEFWRNGGNDLLFDLPVKTGGLIIDAGGYKGDWSAGMIARYGCRSEIFEPVPEFYNHCLEFFKKNNLVRVHKLALGGGDRMAKFIFSDNGTSEYKNNGENFYIDVKVMDIDRFFSESVPDQISCFKMNIEGGEYEVIERLIESKKIELCDSLLIQFHRQPIGYGERYRKIVSELQKTHFQIWCYEMVWEKWVSKKIMPYEASA